MSRISPNLLGDRWRNLPQKDLEPVTLYPRLAGGYGPAVTVGQARRHPLTASVAGERVVLTKDVLVWGLWTATFSDTSYEPRPGDRITDKDGVNWTILPPPGVEKKSIGMVFNCHAKRDL